MAGLIRSVLWVCSVAQENDGVVMLDLSNLSTSRKKLVESVIKNSLREVLYGWPARNLKWVPEETKRVWSTLDKNIKIENSIVFQSVELKALLEAVHLTIYYLGPEELETITGRPLVDFVSAGRILTNGIAGNIYVAELWSEDVE